MSKITTETCVAEIERAFSASPFAAVPEGPVSWVRLSKTGRKGEPIIRVFKGKSDPYLRATVTEIDGALSVELRVVPEWDIDPSDYGKGIDLYAIYEHPVMVAALPFRPSEWAFYVAKGEDVDSDLDVIITIAPLSNLTYDNHPEIPEDMLPRSGDGSPADSVMESTFEVIDRDMAAVRGEMLARGWVRSPEFDAIMEHNYSL